MKKIIIITFLLGAILMPALGIAAEPPGIFNPPAAGTGPGTVPSSGDALLGRIQTISNWVFAIFLAISLIYILLAAFQFVTGGGEPEKVSEARQKLIYAAIGIAIALIAAGFPQILRTIVTTS